MTDTNPQAVVIAFPARRVGKSWAHLQRLAAALDRLPKKDQQDLRRILERQQLEEDDGA